MNFTAASTPTAARASSTSARWILFGNELGDFVQRRIDDQRPSAAPTHMSWGAHASGGATRWNAGTFWSACPPAVVPIQSGSVGQRRLRIWGVFLASGPEAVDLFQEGIVERRQAQVADLPGWACRNLEIKAGSNG